MPKKRHTKYLQSSQTLATSSSARSNKPTKSVNELLSQLRHTSLAASTAHSGTPPPPPLNTPSVPPALRQLLSIPETPSPTPRRPGRSRFDANGRRLPAGPPPPRSWTATSSVQQHTDVSRVQSFGRDALRHVSLPGWQYPTSKSLIGLAIARLAANWAFHRAYDQRYLYYAPSHLKPAIMREVGAYSDAGLSLADLKALLLLPDQGIHGSKGGVGTLPVADANVTALDLTGALGKSLTLKEVATFFFPIHSSQTPVAEQLQDSWEASEETQTAPPLFPALLPNLTHLSLALNPERKQQASWKELLVLAPRLWSVTHLSLAYWPEPCFLQQAARFATVSSPEGRCIPYGGTNYYSHSIDHDWSEALLVLKKLCQSLYTLEFLDLTGCSSWFKALMLEGEHDHVDWVGNWGKITRLRLNTGWNLDDGTSPSMVETHREACEMAARVERHIIAARDGRGRFITVERTNLQQEGNRLIK